MILRRRTFTCWNTRIQKFKLSVQFGGQVVCVGFAFLEIPVIGAAAICRSSARKQSQRQFHNEIINDKNDTFDRMLKWKALFKNPKNGRSFVGVNSG